MATKKTASKKSTTKKAKTKKANVKVTKTKKVKTKRTKAKKAATKKTTAEDIAIDAVTRTALVEFYERNGYMRIFNVGRREDEPRDYKKGYEIRLVARTQRELRTIRRLLRLVGLKGGKPFEKANQWCQPIYGKRAMELFEEWLEAYGTLEEEEEEATT